MLTSFNFSTRRFGSLIRVSNINTLKIFSSAKRYSTSKKFSNINTLKTFNNINVLKTFNNNVNLTKYSLQKRSFFNQFNQQEYKIVRSIKCPPDLLFSVVVDVAKYHQFVPYCTHSFVNAVDSNSLPLKGGFEVGFQEYSEKIVCILHCEDNEEAPKLVEAQSVSDNVFENLKMKWYIEEDSRKGWSRMAVLLNYKFSNPMYNAVSAIFAPKLIDVMVKAFSEETDRRKALNRE